MSEWTDDLICAHVDCDADRDIISVLGELSDQGSLEGWFLEQLGIPGAHPWCLRKGDIKIALYQSRKNIAITSNVLPTDELQDASKSNEYIKILHDIFNRTNGKLNSNIG
ncbi:hypothetical protein ACR9H8_20580 [Kosakonia cowanii]